MIAMVGTTHGMESAGAPSGGVGRFDGTGAGVGSGGGATSVRDLGMVSCRWAALPEPTSPSVMAWLTASANAEYWGAVDAWRRAKASAPRRSSMEYVYVIVPSLK